MIKLPPLILSILLTFSAFGQVLDPSDPIVEYDSENPPTTPAWGTLSKWVITPSVNWNSNDWKAYYYNQTPFRLRFPNNYDPNRTEPYPLIVILHGRGFSNGTVYMNDRHLDNAGAKTYEDGINSGKFDGFVLSPQGTTGYFGDGHYNGIEEVINMIDQQHNLDINRVVVTGRSAGAQAVWRFIAAKPRLFAAALPMSGSARNFIDGVEGYKYSDIWLFQGELDPNPHPDESWDLINDIINEGGNARYSVYLNTGHSVFNKAYDDPDFFPYMNRARKFNPIVLDGELVLSIENNTKQEYEFFPKNEFCPGEDIIATLGLTPGFAAYEWRKDGVLIQGANSNELSVTEFGVYDSRIFRNGEWSPWSTKPIEVSLKPPTETPDIQVQNLASKVLPALDGSDSVTLELPGGFVEYYWYKVGDPTIIGTSRVYTATEPGNYEASVVEPFGCSSNKSQSFKVVDASGAQKPDPAIGLVGFASSETTLQLNWSENPSPNFNETGFEIYTSETQGGPYELLHITGPDVVSFAHEDLIANTTHYYIIRAVNEFGASAATSELSLTTLVDSESPTAPTNLQIVSTSPNSVELSWDAATDNVGIWKYDIYRNGVKTIVTDQQTITVFNLISQQAYNFRIKARDITGNESPFSNQVIAATVFSGTPLAKLKFDGNLTDASSNGVNSSFSGGASFDDTNTHIGSHSLRLSSGSALVDLDGGNQFIHDEFFTRTVAFWLYADATSGIQDVFDEGGSTNGFAMRINNGTIELGVQDNQDIYIISAPFVAQEWHHVAGTFNNGILKLYIDAIELATESNLNYTEVSAHTDGSGIGGTNGSNAFDVANNNFIGNIDDFYIDDDVLNGSHLAGLMSGDTYVIPDIVPAAPTDLNATANSYDAIDLIWVDNSDNETGFQIYRSLQEDDGYAPITIVGPNTTSYSDSDLLPETTYFYKVIALGQYGQSTPPSNADAIAYLPLDNSTADESGNGVTTQTQNGATFSSTIVKSGSHSAYFPGGNDYLNIDNGNQFIHDEFAERAVAFWFYADDISGLQDLFDEGGSTNGFGIRINNGALEFAVQDNQDIQSVSGPIQAGEWIHQVSVFDNGSIYLFLNGVKVDSLDVSYSTVSDHGNDGGLGATNSSNAFDVASNNFNGYIDDFYVFNAAINEVDVLKLFNLADNQPYATTLSLPPVPAAAGNLVATASSGTSIDLIWEDNSDNELGFKILRSSGSPNNYLKVDEVAVDSESYTDNGLFSNVSYFYKVEAYNAGGGSESNEASTQTLNTIPVIDDFGDLQLRFDEELVISLVAQDPDNETLTFSSFNLPPFTSITDVGDGSGALFITPSSTDVGLYEDLMVIVTDQHNGADTVFFSINVNGNHTPTIDPIADITLDEGESILINITAEDLDGNEDLIWTTNGLPAFASFNSQTDGTATIDIVTDFTSAGTYNIDVTVTDPEESQATTSFILTVNEVNPNQVLLINFKHTKNGPAPWNNVSALSASNLIDDQGENTGINLNFQTTTWKSFNDGAITGNNSGIYPDNVIDDYYYFGIFGAPETINVLVSGLDPTRQYNFEFFGSSVWTGTPDNGNTDYTIGGQTVSLYVQGNNSNTVTISGVSPNASGEVTFTMSKGTGASVGYLNALVIESILDDGSAPAAPQNLTSQFDSNQNLVLTWNDAPYNEDGYQVHRSDDGTNFSILDDLPANSTTYTDQDVSDNQTYYYKISAFNSNGSSDFSNTVTVNVPNIPPTLSPIGNINVGVNETVVIPITATDPPLNNITLAAIGLPAFASFVDLGGGNGELTLVTSEGDLGTYENVEITATDDADDSRSEIISITVDQDILYSVAVNFTKNTTQALPWNNTGKNPAVGDFFGSLVDDQSNNSGLGVRLLTAFGGSYNQGAQTGNNSGVVPDNVLKEYYWFGIFNAPQTVTLRVEGLDALERYTFKFVGSSVFSQNGVTDNGETVYKIGNQQVIVDVQANTTEMGVITGVAPDSQGYVTIELLKGTGSAAGYLNAMIIEAYEAEGDAFIPTNLSAVGVSTAEVQLSWEDKTPDETGFEIHRSDNGEAGPYNLLATTATDATSFSDGTVIPGTIHYYQVRAIRPSGATNFSNTANGAAILFSVLININGDVAYNASVPWNNIGTLPSNGQLFTGFKDLNSNETGIRLLFEQTMTGYNDWGTTTGDNSGVYPDLVMKSFYFNDAFDEPGHIIVEGLDQSLNYNFSFFGAIVTGFQIYTNFTIGETTVTNAQTDNISNVSTIYGVVPDINSEAHIQVQEASGSNWAIFNAMVIDAYPVPVEAGSARTTTGVTSVSNSTGTSVYFGNDPQYELSIFPVPFDKSFTIDISGRSTEFLDVQLVDISGRIVFNKKFNTATKHSLDIDTSTLVNGVYLLEIRDNLGNSKTLRVLKK